MRLALLVMGTVGTGAWGIGATHGVFPMPEQMRQAVTALGGDPAKLQIGEINPVQAYHYVVRQVTSGAPAAGFPPSASSPPSGAVNAASLPTVITGPGTPGVFPPSLPPDAREDGMRMRDMASDRHSPAVWQVVPPR